MKRLILKLFALIAIMLVSVNAQAYVDVWYEGMQYRLYEGTSDDSYSYGSHVQGMRGAVLISTNGKTGEIRIPSSVLRADIQMRRYPVIAVSGNDDTFLRHSGITKIVIPNTVRCMEDNSLCEMSDLKELVFEDGSDDLWMGCGSIYALKYQELTYYTDNLEKVTLGRNLVWNTDRDEPFEGKYALKTITITPGCTHIGVSGTNNNCRRLFNSCSEVEDIIIEDSDTPLYVEYCGLYMKNSAAAWNQWKNIYIGRTVQYPGWDTLDDTAWGEGYSPFYALGNREARVTIGKKVTRIGDYMFYDSYFSRLDCNAEAISINAQAFGAPTRLTAGTPDHAEGIYFNTVYLDQENLRGGVLRFCNVDKVIVKPSCRRLGNEGTYGCFWGNDIREFIIEEADTPVEIPSTIRGEYMSKFFCYRTITTGQDWLSGNLHVFDEMYFGGKCTSIPNPMLQSLGEHSPVIRIGSSVKEMGKITMYHSDSRNVFPTIVFEAESKDALPKLRKSDRYEGVDYYWLTGGGRNKLIPIYLHCSIDPNTLGESWNCTNFQKWHPKNSYVKGNTKAANGLYPALCSGCRTHQETDKWYVSQWNGGNDLVVKKNNSNYKYDGELALNDNNTAQTPVNIACADIKYNRTVVGGSVESLILPFDLSQASYINGSVFQFVDYADGNFSFERLADDAPVKACTPYLVVVANDATQLLKTGYVSTLLYQTVNADLTPKKFNASNGGATYFGGFVPQQLESNASEAYYVYDAAADKFVKVTSATTLNQFRAAFRVTGTSTPATINLDVKNPNAVHHLACEATPYQRGFTQECWEDVNTYKIYSDISCTSELDAAKVVKYYKLQQNPIKERGPVRAFGERESEMIGDTSHNYVAKSALFALITSGVPNYVIFQAKEEHVGNARLVWSMDNFLEYNEGYREYKYAVHIYVNDTEIYQALQDNGNIIDGTFVLPLPNLKGGDNVKFEYVMTDGRDDDHAELKACLEYTPLLICKDGLEHEFPAGSCVCNKCDFVKIHDHDFEEYQYKCSLCDAAHDDYLVGFVGSEAKRKNVEWRIKKGASELLFSGNGDMEDFNLDHNQWKTEYMNNITSVVIGEGITGIGGTTRRDAGYFHSMSNMSDITLPSTLTKIGSYAFYGNTALQEINLSENVKEIANSAFQNSGLQVVTVNGNPTIGEYAFADCESLRKFYLMKNVPVEADGKAFSNPEDITLYVNSRLFEWAKETEPWSNFGIISPLHNIEYTDSQNEVHTISFNRDGDDANILTFTDGEVKNLIVFEDIKMKQFTYTRNFSAANTWQALYVPFEMSYSDWADEFDVAAISNFHEYTDENGETEKIELEVRYVKNGKLRANVPYLIRAKEAGVHSFVFDDAILKATKEQSISCSSTERRYTFTGTYNTVGNLNTNDYIFLSGGKLCKSDNDNDVLKPMRWYLAIEEYDNMISAPSPAFAKPITIRVIGEDETTGIENITVVSSSANAKTSGIYSITGAKLAKPQQGINIINGNKVVVK